MTKKREDPSRQNCLLADLLCKVLSYLRIEDGYPTTEYYEIIDADDIHDLDLLMHLMITLGGIHSRGGVTIHRTFHSALRECAIYHLWHISNFGEIENPPPRDDLIQSAMGRKMVHQYVLFDVSTMGITAAPGWWLASELLEHLRHWYLEDAKRPDSLFSERQLVEAICNLIPKPHERPCFEARALMMESWDRMSYDANKPWSWE